MEKHYIPGGSGSMGQAITRELRKRGIEPVVVGRRKSAEGVKTIQADLTDRIQTGEALKEADYIYLCVGLLYDSKVWERDWPRIMDNVIEAASVRKAKVIFLDNVYMYGPALPRDFDESTEQSPVTRKGKVRKRIAEMLLKAHHEGRLQAVIGRSADFYGEGVTNSIMYISFMENLLKGKKPQWLFKRDQPHTYASVADNAKALVTLAFDSSSYGQVFHLPVSGEITPQGIIDIINKETGSSHTISYVPGFIMTLLSWFVPVIKEVREMAYQFNAPYIISWEKFRSKYPDFRPAVYREEIVKMLHSFQGKENAG